MPGTGLGGQGNPGFHPGHWTGGKVATILRPMLKRILTLFAILTGLAAMAAPAQARMTALDGLELHAAGDNIVKCADKSIAQQIAPAERIGERRPQVLGCRPAVITIVIPTVQLQADRARE